MLCGWRYLKKKPPFFQVWDIVSTGKQIEKNLFCHWKNTSKLSRTWSLALPIHNFLSHLHFFKVSEIMLKYGDSILPAEHILDLYCLWLSNAALFRENHVNLYFNAKRLEKGLIRNGVKLLVTYFQKSFLSGQYRTLP